MSNDPHFDSQGRAAQGEFYSSGGLNDSTGREPFEDGRHIETEVIGGGRGGSSVGANTTTTTYGSNTAAQEYERSTEGAIRAGGAQGATFDSNNTSNINRDNEFGSGAGLGSGVGSGLGSSGATTFDSNNTDNINRDNEFGSSGGSRGDGDNDVDDRSHGYGVHKGQGNLGGHTFGDEAGRPREGAANTDRFDVDRSSSAVDSDAYDRDNDTTKHRSSDTGTHATDTSLGGKIVNAIRGDRNA